MANLFLDVRKDILAEKDDPLNYINYSSISEENREFIQSNLWDMEWLETPHAVYFPGNDLLKVRTQAVNPSFNAGLSELSAVIRQFYIRQTVISGQSNGTISVDYVDREDQSIRAWINDWRDKIWGLKDRYQFRKEDTQGTVKLTQYNTSRKAIAVFVMYSVQLNGGADDIINKAFNSEDPSNNGEYSITFSFEHYDVQWANM